jgi:hypothetical protein
MLDEVLAEMTPEEIRRFLEQKGIKKGRRKVTSPKDKSLTIE